MLWAVRLLPPTLLLLLLLLAGACVRVQSQQELSEVDILCIRQSPQDTALGRWLGCLQSLDAGNEDEQPTSDNGLDDDPQNEEPVVKEPRHDRSSMKEELVNQPFCADEVLDEQPIADNGLNVYRETEEPMVIQKEPRRDPFTLQEEETQTAGSRIGEVLVDNSRPESLRLSEDWNVLIKNKSLTGDDPDKGSRHDDSSAAHIDAGNEEDSDAEEAAITELRDIEGNIFFDWLRLNLGVLALGKLLLCMVHGCRGKRSDKANSLTVASELREVAARTAMNGESRASHLQMLGSSVGSAVGAVFAEVVLKMGCSGSPISTDKISMILESALVESSILVEDDEQCTKLLSDFKASFRSTYTMLYRIHQASSLCGDRKHVNCMHCERDTSYMLSGFKGGISDFQQTNTLVGGRQFGDISVNNTLEMDPLLDAEQKMKRVVSLSKSSCGDEEGKSFLTVELLSEEHKSSDMVADDVGGDAIQADISVNNTLEMDPLLDAEQEVQKVVPLSKSSCDDKEGKSFLTLDAFSEEHKSSDMVADDVGGDAIQARVSEGNVHPHADSNGNEDNVFIDKNSNGNEDHVFIDKNPISNIEVAIKDIVEEVLPPEYQVDDASSVCEEPSSIMQSGMLAFMDQSQGAAVYQKSFLAVFERHVQAQEQHNQLKYVEVKHLMRQRILEKEKLRLTQDANMLMRENIDLGRSKACFKEATVLEKQAKDAYASFSKTCADELVAGLFVMLVSLLYGTRKYSVVLLSELVSTCQPYVKEPRRPSAFRIDWFYTSLDMLAAKLQAFLCHVTVSARILVGGILGIIVVSALLRRSVTSSSQAMPATVLLVVLGGVCGYVGKLSVDSLGGSGTRWCIMWEIFCFLHAFTNCLTPLVYKLIHGPLFGHKAKFGPPFWIRKFAFHCMLLVVLPGLAGQLPFASLYHVMNDISLRAVEVWSSVLFCISEWSVHIISMLQRTLVQYIR